MSKISIIIPVYNMEKYLNKCLDSIFNQTSNNWEIILVDDGSTDDSHYISRKYSEIDSRVLILRQANQGQGAARNLGILNASGDYICFVDPDDWIESNMVEDLLFHMDGGDYDFTNFGFNFINQNLNVSKNFNSFDYDILRNEEIFKDSLLDKNIYSISWNKIYRKSFLNSYGITFPGLRAYEDIFFSKLVSKNAIKCSFINKIYYHALMRNDSTTRKITADSVKSALQLVLLEENFFKNDSNYFNIECLFNAHKVKFIAGFLIHCAFRVENINDYLRFYKEIEITDFKKISLRLSVLKLLTIKNIIIVFIARYRYLARFSANILKLLNIQPY